MSTARCWMWHGAARRGSTQNCQVTREGPLKWGDETAKILSALAKARALSVPQVLQGRVEAAWIRRWSAILACSDLPPCPCWTNARCHSSTKFPQHTKRCGMTGSRGRVGGEPERKTTKKKNCPSRCVGVGCGFPQTKKKKLPAGLVPNPRNCSIWAVLASKLFLKKNFLTSLLQTHSLDPLLSLPLPLDPLSRRAKIALVFPSPVVHGATSGRNSMRRRPRETPSLPGKKVDFCTDPSPLCVFFLFFFCFFFGVEPLTTFGHRLAAMLDLRAALQKNDIMRSGLWPPVSWPHLRCCRTECGTASTAMCATHRQNTVTRLLSKIVSMLSVHAKEAGSLSRGSRRSVFGTNLATGPEQVCLGYDCRIWSAGQRLLVSGTTCCETGVGGVFWERAPVPPKTHQTPLSLFVVSIFYLLVSFFIVFSFLLFFLPFFFSLFLPFSSCVSPFFPFFL